MTVLTVGPQQSLNAAINKLKPGDTLMVEAGNYHEKVTVSTPNVTIRGVNGIVEIDGKVGRVGGINSGLPTGNLNKVAPDGKGGTENGLFDIVASNVTIEGIRVINSRGKGIRIWDKHGTGVRNVTVRNCLLDEARRHSLLVDADDVLIEHCIIRGSGSFYTENRAAAKSTDWSAALPLKGNNVVIRNCLIEENFGEGIAATPNRPDFKGFVENCVFKDNFRGALFQVFSNAIVRNNLFLYTGKVGMPGGAQGVNIAQGEDPGWGVTSNMLFENNVIIGFKSAIRFSGQPHRDLIKNVTMRNNTIYDCGKGITPQTGNAQNMHMERNIVYKCRDQIDDLYNGNRFRAAWTRGPGFWEKPVPAPYQHPNDKHGNPEFVNENANFNNRVWDLSSFMVKPGGAAQGFGASGLGIIGPGADIDNPDPPDPPSPPDPPEPPEEKPDPPLLNPIQVSGQDIIVSWQASEQDVMYRLQQRWDGNMHGWQLIETDITDNERVYLDMSIGLYEYRVRVHDGQAWSDWSNVEAAEVTDTPSPPTDPPDKPTEIEIDIEVGMITWQLVLTEDSVTAIRRE